MYEPKLGYTPQYQVAGMSFDAERLEQRRNTLGASEIAAVAGLNPYKSPIEVWQEKRGIGEAFTGNEFTEWGLRMEEVIAQKYAELMHVHIVPSLTLVHSDEPWMSATPDRIVRQLDHNDPTAWGLECKNKSAQQIVKWGDSGSDLIPNDIAAQVHWSMMVVGAKWWDVAVLFGGNTFRHYRLHYNDEIAQRFLDIGKAFWFDNVLAGVPPEIDGSRASTEWLKKAFASHSELVREATNEETKLVFKLRGLREEKAIIEADEDLQVNLLKASIGEDAGIVCRGGRVTWKAPKPTKVINWEYVAAGLATKLAEYTSKSNADYHLASEIAFNTTQKENTRRFLLTIPKD